jgi:hypothetical protein|tara:strand:- start:2720 stop:3079 length:360 start_codon:yes stop_codon:yes gene_type:complete
MSKKINKIEKAILMEVARFNIKEYPCIEEHINYLTIKNRERTGVGQYIYFSYLESDLEIQNCMSKDTTLSADRSLEIDTLEFGLNYELNITKGRLDFLELVTNGEDWNGDVGKFEFVQY